MKLTSMKVGMIAVGMIVVGTGIGILAFLGGAKTNISFSDGEVTLSHPFDRKEILVEHLSEEIDGGYKGKTGARQEANTDFCVIQEKIANITQVDIAVDTLDVNIVEGEDYAIDIKYKDTTDVFYEVSGDKLTIQQEDIMERKFFERDGRKGEVIIYLPKEAFIEKIDVDMSMGSGELSDIQINKLDISCGMGSIDMNNISLNKGYIEGGMGTINATNIVSNGLEVSMGMGSADIQGDLKGLTDIEGGMGELRLTTFGKETDYNYDLSKGMGTISVNGRKNNGFEDLRENNGADNKIVIEGGMGSITVNTED